MAIGNAEVQTIIRAFRSEFAERKSSLSNHKLMKGYERFTKDKQTYGMLSASFQMQVYLPKASCRYEFRQPTHIHVRLPKSAKLSAPLDLCKHHLAVAPKMSMDRCGVIHTYTDRSGSPVFRYGSGVQYGSPAGFNP